MKQVLILSAALTLASPMAQAQSGMDMKDMDMNKKSTDMRGMDVKGKDADKQKARTHKAVGTVKNVDATAGKVTLAHGPVQTLKWPAMTMTFTVKDKALLGKFSPDKKVEFEFVQQGFDYAITSAK